ncbi:MAG: TonB-dependent receptor [Elusimicrobia bacterium]|nr:TonB-dependent receptor [Elusimicrobiota bacterium]
MMKKFSAGVFVGLLAISTWPVDASAQGMEDEALFFGEIPVVVTASRKPQLITQAPATAYVLTQEDIKASGVQTLWDALRQVPGVEVLNTRTFAGDVSIRGLNQALSNHTLVLLDGRTLLTSFFNTLTWEAIPVSLEEIDRIEVVEGPASALYGANAVTGVINIITKRPDQLKGGVASYTGGERKTHFGSAVYGDQTEKLGYKTGLDWRSTYRFSDADLRASDVSKAHALMSYRLGEKTDLSVSGGLANNNTQLSAGGVGTMTIDGPSGFLRTDLLSGPTKLRAFWNYGNRDLRDFLLFGQPSIVENTLDVNLEQALPVFCSNEVVVGANYRRNTVESIIFDSKKRGQDLWALFFDDQWKPADKWTIALSGRFDRHPLTNDLFSPRGSVIFTPVRSQTFRFSAGSAFKYPTLLENYLLITPILPNPGAPPLTNPPFTFTMFTNRGSKSLLPERMTMTELSHQGTFGRWKTTTALFAYDVKDIIDRSPVVITSAVPPFISGNASFQNRGHSHALGGEFGAEVLISRRLTSFANYSYHSFDDEYESDSAGALSSPKHKVNGGVRLKTGGLTSGLWVHWVDKTFWNANQTGLAVQRVKVDDYTLVNAHVGYAFQKRLKGWEAAVDAFNIGNKRHDEVLPAVSIFQPGQNGEIVGSRVTGTVSYKF